MPADLHPEQPRLTPVASVARHVGAAAISGLAALSYLEASAPHESWRIALDVALGLVCFAVVHRRRHNPVAIGVLTGLLTACSTIATGPATLAAVSVASSRRWGPIAAVGVANLIGAELLLWYLDVDDGIPLWINSLINVVVIAAILGWGMYIGSRRELMWTLRERAERAEAEHDLREGKARGDERSRIAREMHDVLAHRISQVSMHAGALAFREDLTAEQMRASATVIQEQANLALTDLRTVLGVLRDPETGELRSRPQPTYADIGELVTESRRAGMTVEYADSLVADGVPEAAGRALYRIVQEGLTNARKHASGAVVRVQISGDREAGIDIVVRNPLGFARPPAAPGSQLGLVGLAERVELVGGRLEHSREGSMFVLHGWIPWAS